MGAASRLAATKRLRQSVMIVLRLILCSIFKGRCAERRRYAWSLTCDNRLGRGRTRHAGELMRCVGNVEQQTQTCISISTENQLPAAGFAATCSFREPTTEHAKKTPRGTGAFSQPGSGVRDLRGYRVLDHLCALRTGVDRDLARLLRLGNLADEVDVKQPVLERGVLHLHEIGKLECALESTRGDAAVQHFGLRVLVGDFFALDRQRVFLRDDGELILGKARDSNGDAVVVLAGALDIVGGITGAAVRTGLVEQVEEAVEADGGTVEGGQVVRTHGQVLH